MSPEELRTVFNNVDSISELTGTLWGKNEEHERVNGLFKDKGDMFAWVRRNLKTSIMYMPHNMLLQG